MTKYYQEENYKRGVALYAAGAHEVLMFMEDANECKPVTSLKMFKNVYRNQAELAKEFPEWAVTKVHPACTDCPFWQTCKANATLGQISCELLKKVKVES